MHQQELINAMSINDPSNRGGGTYAGPQQWTNGLGQSGYMQIVANYCSGNYHLWACEHAERCKCGKATRKVEPRICSECNK